MKGLFFFLKASQLLAVLIFGLSVHAEEICGEVNTDVDIFYINGMNTPLPSPAELDQLIHFRNAFSQMPRVFQVKNNYVATEGPFLDLLEALNQKIGLEARQAVQSAAVVAFWQSYLGAPNSAPLTSILTQAAIDGANRSWIARVKRYDNISAHLAAYRQSLNAGRAILLFGYSQGSIYAQHSYQVLISEGYDPKKIGVYLMGAVVDSVPGEPRRAAYKTLSLDLVVAGVSLVFPGTLPSNGYYNSPNDWTNHRFPTYFLEAGSPRQQIISTTGYIKDELTRQCKQDKVIPCGSTLVTSGGSGNYGYSHFLGNQPGDVQLQFEAYSIPDSLTIKKADGSSLYSTRGFVSAYRTGSFFYDPASNPDSYVKVNVGGNVETPGTLWKLTVGCPGQNLQENRTQVTFSFGSSTANFSCKFDLYDNGVRLGSVGLLGGSVNGLLSKGGDNHLIEYRNKVCTQTKLTGDGYPAIYRDSQGSHVLASPIGVNKVTIVIK